MATSGEHATGPRADRQAALKAAVAARLERVARQRNLAPVLEAEAAQEAREFAKLLRDGQADIESLFMLGWLHWYRYQALPEGPDQPELDSAISMLTPCFLGGVELNRLPEPLLPDLADQAASPAHALLARALSSNSPELISAVVNIWTRLLTVTPDDHPDRLNRLASLSMALQNRFNQTGALTDLDQAIRVGQEAVRATPSHSPGRPGRLSNLGFALQTRFERTGALADLDQAIQAGRDAVACTQEGHPDRVEILNNLRGGLLIKFRKTGAIADLNELIAIYRDVISASASGHPDRAEWLFGMGILLHNRFARKETATDLEEAIQMEREAIAAIPEDHPQKGDMLASLGMMLQIRFGQTGTSADLEEAIRLGRESIAATPQGHQHRRGMLSQLRAALNSRFEQSGAQADLDLAIEVCTEEVAAASGDPDRLAVLAELSGLLHNRIKRTNDLADLDEAIRIDRERAAAIPQGEPERAAILSDLGVTLHLRFLRTDALPDLNDAIVNHREAVATGLRNHPNRAGWLTNLGSALLQRFRRTSNQADLDEAIANHREAAVATPRDHPNRAAVLSNLGNSLRTRFGLTATLTDLDQAIQLGQEAVTHTPVGHADRGAALSSLESALRDRFRLTGVLGDLDDAIGVGKEAVAATSSGHPAHAERLSSLGYALRARFERTGEQADLLEAIDAFGRAVDAETGSPSARIGAARAASDLAAASRPEWAADLMERAVRLLPEVAPRQLDRGDQQHALGGLSGLAGDAAALVLTAPANPEGERAELALQLLEAGRAVLFSQALELRGDLSDLADRNPDLAARFIRLRDLLDRVSDLVVPSALPEFGDQGTNAASEADRLAEDRRQLARELAEVSAEIRTKEGFGSFARPPSTAELLQQAAAGPVVVFNVSRYRSDALLLTEGGITSLALPGLAMDTVTTQINAFHQALYSTAHGRTSPERAAAQRQLNQILGWLWDAAAGPALDALGYRTQPDLDTQWPRVWWAPGGLMGLLPIHAAGHHSDPADAPGRRAVIDRVISSYTPTITALRHARHPTPVSPPAGQDKTTPTLIVAMPTTPGLPGHGRLRFVPEEARMLAQRLPGAITLSEPDPDDGASGTAGSDTNPTRANVLAYLAACPAAHFACHGVNDPADPSSSRLLLHDHRDAPLTVSALASVHLDHAQMAYLSACDTALSASTRLIDEAIHLASAFQLAGYPHVIGTLWAIDDYVAVQIADTFYAALTNCPSSAPNASFAAAALHEAVRAVRDALPTTPSLWASHIHVGA